MKKFKIVQIIREVLITIAPLLILAAFPLNIALDMLGKTHVTTLDVSYIVAIVGFTLLCLYFIASAVYYIFKEKEAVKKASAGEVEIIGETNEKPKSKTKLFYDKYILSNEVTVKIIVNIVAAILCILPLTLTFSPSYYWDVYFMCTVAMWGIWIYTFVELFYSKSKNTFITMAVFVGVMFCLLVPSTVIACKMYFEIATMTSTLIINSLITVFAALSILPLRVAMANGKIEKTKRSRNFGLGVITLVVSIIMFLAPGIASSINGGIEGSTISERIYNLSVVMTILEVLIFLVIGLVIFNITYNSKHYVSKKNYLGVFDILCSVTAVILSVLAIVSMHTVMLGVAMG